MKKLVNNVRVKVFMLVSLLSILLWDPYIVFGSTTETTGGKISTSKIVTGTKNLISDIQSAFLIIIPLATVLWEMILFSKLQNADDTDEKPIKKKMKVVLICGIASFVVDALVGIILNYYK